MQHKTHTSEKYFNRQKIACHDHRLELRLVFQTPLSLQS